MRIVVTLDKDRREVVVTADSTGVRSGELTAPVKVVRTSGRTVELEIGDERVTVEGWPEHLPDPPAEIIVNGETFALAMERSASGSTGSASRIPTPPIGAPAPIASPTPATAGTGAAVSPPMPGKVIELRVAEGAQVVAGQVLLVIEAMKMRNEVASPIAGTVRDLSVAAGANVRAKQVLLRIAPD